MNRTSLSRFTYYAACFLVSGLVGTASYAEDWIFLGGKPAAELDVDSVGFIDGALRANIRLFVDKPEGRVFFNQDLDVDCRANTMIVAATWITSNFSARIVEMPGIPEDQRRIAIPAGNEAYNRMFDYVCQSGMQ